MEAPPKKAAGPYLRFVLLEVDAESGTAAATPMSAPAEKMPWADAELKLRLPYGSPRPPLLCAQLWDGASPAKSPIAQAEVRLDGANGSTTSPVKLEYKGGTSRDKNGKPKVQMRRLAIRFAFSTKDDEPTAAGSGAAATPKKKKR